jgi:hypothetical protein
MPDVVEFMKMFVADHFTKSVLVGEDGLPIVATTYVERTIQHLSRPDASVF